MSAPLDIFSEILESEVRAREMLSALAGRGWLCVPRLPTEEMIESAWADALAENAAGVWESMIEVVEKMY